LNGPRSRRLTLQLKQLNSGIGALTCRIRQFLLLAARARNGFATLRSSRHGRTPSFAKTTATSTSAGERTTARIGAGRTAEAFAVAVSSSCSTTLSWQPPLCRSKASERDCAGIPASGARYPYDSSLCRGNRAHRCNRQMGPAAGVPRNVQRGRQQ